VQYIRPPVVTQDHVRLLLTISHFDALLRARYLRFLQWRVFASFGRKATHFVAEGHAVGGHVVRFLARRPYAFTRIWVELLGTDNSRGRWRKNRAGHTSVRSCSIDRIGPASGSDVSRFARLKRHHLLGCSCRLVHTE